MVHFTRLRRLFAGTAIVAAVALTTSGCGSSGSNSAVADQSTSTSTAAGAPAPAAPAAGGTNAAAAASGKAAATGTTAAATAAKTDTSAKGAATTATGTTSTAVAPAKVAKGGTTKAAGGKAPVAAPGQPAAPADAGATTTGAAAVAKVVASAPIFGGTTPCVPANLSEVPIGNVSTLSGILGELFAPARSAIQTFVASQNACGGLNGHKIKLFIDDDQDDPATAASKVTEMIQKNKVLAFCGNIQVLTMEAVAPVVKKYGIPIIGTDISNNTWFTTPLVFPQGSDVQSISYGYLDATKNYFHKTVLGNLSCIEVPRPCEALDRSIREMAPQFGIDYKKNIQTSITAPSYVQQCLDMKTAGVEALILDIDAASMVRVARSCEQVGYFPKVLAYPLAVGNEKQFLAGDKWLGDTYVPMNVFPWQGNVTPAEKYWQDSIKKFNPGFTSGGAASLGWSAGALLVAASAELSATNPTTQQFLDALWEFKGQKFTELGGLAGPRTFGKDQNPRVPYCLFNAIGNDTNTGWKSVADKPTCSKVVAASDPQHG
jgi:branched-chain amino acid transport system substrate-binding protein